MNFRPFGLFTQLKRLVIAQSTRGHKMDVLHSWTGGVKYPSFTYYPRPGQVDPPCEPAKLFMVQRIKPFFGNNIKMKRILTSLGLGEMSKTSDIAIVKNCMDMNGKLWRIKHLIKITPITMPDGLPAEGEFSSAHLDSSSGVFRVKPELKHDEKRIALCNEFHSSSKKVKTDIWKKDCRQRWTRLW